MATKTIPARTETTCDVCKVLCTPSNRAMSCTLNFDRAGLDYQGCAVGPGGFKLELCDKCCSELEDAVTFKIALIREGAK